jgi:hypothetical protein
VLISLLVSGYGASHTTAVLPPSIRRLVPLM